MLLLLEDFKKSAYIVFSVPNYLDLNHKSCNLADMTCGKRLNSYIGYEGLIRPKQHLSLRATRPPKLTTGRGLSAEYTYLIPHDPARSPPVAAHASPSSHRGILWWL